MLRRLLSRIVAFIGNIIVGIIASPKAADLAQERRRNLSVHAYVGRNGAGKTCAAVADTLPDLDAGVYVLSTVRLLDFRNLRPCDDDDCTDQLRGQPGHMAAHPFYIPFTSWDQMIKFRNGVILMDEITGIADSGDGVSVPAAINNLFAQMRRQNVVLRITALSFIRANKRLREAIVGVTRCQSFMPVQAFDADGKALAWKQRRLSKLTTFDAQTLPTDDHTESAYDKADKIVTARVWLPRSLAITAYDTYAPVLRVGHVSEAGRCVHCDGTRRVPECTCFEYVSKKPVRGKAGEEGSRTAHAEREDRSPRPATRSRSRAPQHASDDPCGCSFS